MKKIFVLVTLAISPYVSAMSTASTSATAQTQMYNYDYDNAVITIAQKIRKIVAQLPVKQKGRYFDRVHRQFTLNYDFPYSVYTTKQGILLKARDSGRIEMIISPKGGSDTGVVNAYGDSDPRLLDIIISEHNKAGIEVKLYRDEVNTVVGKFGPLYEITSINGSPVPPAVYEEMTITQ